MAIEFQLGFPPAFLLSLFLAIVYVGSLYIWKTSADRDNPDTIKRRFLSVSIVCLLAPPFLWIFSSNSDAPDARTLWEWLGIRISGIIPASVLPFVLTFVLFLGPVVLQYVEGIIYVFVDPRFWWASLRDIYWLRNHVVAPFSEEFIFRACMLPLLVPSLGATRAIFMCPLLFGVAHLHHVYEMVKQGTQFQDALFVCLFQFVYTTLFGIYSGYLFVQTGHLAAPVIVHAFCNHMGFPNFGAVLSYKRLQTRLFLMAAFTLGLVGWVISVRRITEPSLYSNHIYSLDI
ncbi:CAAX prenyl protease 2-like [Lineus longissimus]|uniref:CAAX prenyl protease 2-like n=1 Tax=Lineus longissimus TaxID=88925 RepID=UPI002B4E6BDB